MHLDDLLRRLDELELTGDAAVLADILRDLIDRLDRDQGDE